MKLASSPRAIATCSSPVVGEPIVRSIETRGFAVLPGVLSGTDIAVLVASLGDLERSRAGSRHALRHSCIRTLANDARLLDIARAILGPGAFPFGATLFDKSPASNWLVVWHQDTALPVREVKSAPGWGPWSTKAGVAYGHAPTEALERVVALRIHLDDSTVDNGPLRVLPGTHHLGVLTDEEVQRLPAGAEPVDCIVPRGGVLAMRPLLVHASSKSRQQQPRRVVHIEYASSLILESGLELRAV